MRKITQSLLLSLTAANAFAQISPLKDFSATNLTEHQASSIWRSQKTSFKSGSECFNRALTWSYDINKKFNVDGKKILIHYSRKYNEELSKKWGFHISPVYNVEGTDYAFDKGFQPWIDEPLTKKMWEEKFLIVGTEKLVKHKQEITEDLAKVKRKMRDLDRSSEFYYQELAKLREKKAELKQKEIDFNITDQELEIMRPIKIKRLQAWINYYENKLAQTRSSNEKARYSNEVNWRRTLIRKVKTDLAYAAHIECKKITNIEELDYNLMDNWCYIQEVSQYYWGVPQLRLLNYGQVRTPALPDRDDNPYFKVDNVLRPYRLAGESYAQESFNRSQLWAARKQAFPEYKEIWKYEYQQKERSEDIVDEAYSAINKYWKLKKTILKQDLKLKKLLKENRRYSRYVSKDIKEISSNIDLMYNAIMTNFNNLKQVVAKNEDDLSKSELAKSIIRDMSLIERVSKKQKKAISRVKKLIREE